MRRGLLGLALAAAAVLGVPALAQAHARLEGTAPQRGATVRHEPSQVVFRFDESVEGNFGAVRVFDGAGRRADAGDAFHPSGQGAQMAVHLKPGLARGSYTATYRVVSADGHIVSGGFVFSIGRGSATRQTVGQLIGRSRSGSATAWAFGVARGGQFLAIAVAVGTIAFMLAVWLPALVAAAGAGGEWRQASGAFTRRARVQLLAAAGLGVASAAAAVVLEGAEAAGVSGWSALNHRIVRETLSTRFGATWGIGALAWVAVAVTGGLLLAAGRKRAPVLRAAELGATGLAVPQPARLLLASLALPLGFLLVMPALAGHASTQSPVVVLFPTNVAHVAAMSVWTGGLVTLLVCLPAATRQLRRDERTQILARVLSRFSPLALGCVAVIGASGLIQAYVYVRTPAHLLDTPFGRAVLVKMLLLIALIALGAYNRRRSVPRLRALAASRLAPGSAGMMLRRVLRGEVLLIVGALAATAALTAYPPSTAAQSGPVSRTVALGPEQLQLTLDPARVGANELHLYLLNPKDGSQFTGAKEVDVAESQPEKGIGPLRQAAEKAGPGHYIVPAAVLGVPGKWQLAITVRVSKFDEYTAAVKVPVR